MQLPLSTASGEHLEFVDECASTNTELVTRSAAAAVPDFSVLVTTNQTGGRGRLGRVWVAPPGQTLAISVLLRPRLASGEPLAIEHFGWLPLIAGLAMTRTVAALVPSHPVSLKWPNDVQVDGRKVSGLLAELLPGGDAVVMGAGLNLFIPQGMLPTATSTSLGLCDPIVEGDELVDAALSGYLTELRSLVTGFLSAGADPVASGIAALMVEHCSTIGKRVRVELPGGDDLLGTATGVDASGRLRVGDETDGKVVAVAAGDVTHLRYQHGV
jgi:BirA family biotin operon repressor/biotin-[acetyl-CoA-carboxylase] ligase